MSQAAADPIVSRPVARRHRYLPQISLLSFLLAVSLGCVVLSHVRLSREHLALQQKHHQVLQQTGYLVIHDPKKIYVRAVESVDDLTWRYQVYLPPRNKYMLWCRTSQNAWGGSGLVQHEDQMTVTIGLSRSGRGDWQLRVITPRSSTSCAIDPELIPTQWEPGYLNMRQHQNELAPDEGFDLLNIMKGNVRVRIQPEGVPDPFTEELLSRTKGSSKIRT